MPLNNVGSSLQVVDGHFGGQVVVFDGQVLDLYEGIYNTFSDENRAVWLTRETIDRDGSDYQWRLTVWGYRKGDKQPRELFEHHAYVSREGTGELQNLQLTPEGVTGLYVFKGRTGREMLADSESYEKTLSLTL